MRETSAEPVGPPWSPDGGSDNTYTETNRIAPGEGNDKYKGQWYFSTELAENPAGVRFPWTQLATGRLMTSFYAFGVRGKIKRSDLTYMFPV